MGNQSLPPKLASLSGSEEILPGVRILDFWSWALGDLRLNSTRGLLAQFLVAKAVGDKRRVDDGWGPYDVESDDGLKIEVKSSGYLQSWSQPKPSAITFQGLITKRWDPINGYSPTKMVVADVYVFAVHTCVISADYNPLDIAMWEFYAIPGSVIRKLDQGSMALSTVRKHAGNAVSWERLRETIVAKAQASELEPEASSN